MEDAVPLLNAVGHHMLQSLGGPALGWAVDAGFDLALYSMGDVTGMHSLDKQPAKIASGTRFLLEAMEFGAQVVLGGLVVGGLASYLASMPLRDADPAMGSVFAILFFASQRRLMHRLRRLGEFVEAELRPKNVVEKKQRDWQRPHPTTTLLGPQPGKNNAMDHRISQQIGVLPPGASSALVM